MKSIACESARCVIDGFWWVIDGIWWVIDGDWCVFDGQTARRDELSTDFGRVVVDYPPGPFSGLKKHSVLGLVFRPLHTARRSGKRPEWTPKTVDYPPSMTHFQRQTVRRSAPLRGRHVPSNTHRVTACCRRFSCGSCRRLPTFCKTAGRFRRLPTLRVIRRDGCGFNVPSNTHPVSGLRALTAAIARPRWRQESKRLTIRRPNGCRTPRLWLIWTTALRGMKKRLQRVLSDYRVVTQGAA